MRVISQDGFYDVPYAQIIIECTSKVIFARDVKNNNYSVELARYSTEEKARKAMELLRTAYTGRFITNAEVSQDFEKEMKELMKGGFGTVMVRDSGSRVEFNNLNGYFRFPAEEELE